MVSGLWLVRAHTEDNPEQGIAEMVGVYVAENSEESEEIDQAWEDARFFNRTMDAILKQAGDGHLSLRHAVHQLIGAAERWNSRYLTGVELFEQGESRLEKVARNIYRHFEQCYRTSPTRENAQRLQHILHELEDIVGRPLTNRELL